MNLDIQLVSFAQFSPDFLGTKLYQIVTKEANRGRLALDFPFIHDFYGTPDQAVQTVVERQEMMVYGLGYVAAVVLVSARCVPRVVGVTTFNQTPVPSLPNVAGLNFAVWLDQDRPPEMRRIGIPLMEARMRYVRRKPELFGHPWTVIRPDNALSMRVWEHEQYPWGGFNKHDEPRFYDLGDEIDLPRQLFVSKQTLAQMRWRGTES